MIYGYALADSSDPAAPGRLVLAFGCALGLTAVDIHLVYRGLSAFYILDAVLQVALVAFWVYGWRRTQQVVGVMAAAGSSLEQTAAAPAPAITAAERGR